MLVSALLQNAQSLIDLFWVGRLGSNAVAALALSGTVLMLLFPVLMGIATGTVALVARAVGAGDTRAASLLAAQSLGIAMLTGLLLGGLCLPLLAPLCRLLHAAPVVTELALPYLRISLYGLFSMCLLFIGNSALQGAGNTVAPMIAMLLANLLNLGLDPLLIFGLGPIPAMGIPGAAIATVLSQIVAAAVVIGLLASGRTRLRLHRGDLAPRGSTVWRLLRIGLPSAGQMLSRSLMGLTLFYIIARYGTETVAGYGIGMRFHMVLLMPCFVLANAAATLVGQNLGAGQPRRARRAAWAAAGLDVAIMAISGLLVFWQADRVVSLFDPNPAVVAIGAGYLRTVTPFYIFAGLAIVLDRALNGAGCTVPTLVFTIIALWGLQVPLAFILSRCAHPPVQGVWWAIAISTVVHAVLSVSWFETGRWQRARV